MRKEFIFIFGLILSISFVLAIPSQPNAFYGKIEYNGESIPGGCSIEAKLNGFSKQCLITNEGYGYGANTCIVTDEGNLRGIVEFYLESVKIGEHIFEPLEITKLDFTIDFLPDCPIDYCGDAICNNGETCSTCSTDCGACPIPNIPGSGGGGGGSSGGGGGGSGAVTLSTSSSDNDETEDLNTEELDETEKQENLGAGITGGIVGFMKSGTGVGLSIAIVLILAGIGVMVFRDKKEPAKKKGKKKSK